MSKSVLTIDTPENCHDCKMLRFWCSVAVCPLAKNGSGARIADAIIEHKTKACFCPLKPLPEPKRKKAVLDSLQYADEQLTDGAYAGGWNDCLREIGGDDGEDN